MGPWERCLTSLLLFPSYKPHSEEARMKTSLAFTRLIWLIKILFLPMFVCCLIPIEPRSPPFLPPHCHCHHTVLVDGKDFLSGPFCTQSAEIFVAPRQAFSGRLSCPLCSGVERTPTMQPRAAAMASVLAGYLVVGCKAHICPLPLTAGAVTASEFPSPGSAPAGLTWPGFHPDFSSDVTASQK